MQSAKELHEKMFKISLSYFLVDVRKDKEDFYAVKKEDMREYWLCYSGKFLNYVMEGRLKEAWDLIEELPEHDFMRLGLTLVHPEVTWKQFAGVLKYLKKVNQSLNSVILTAARPSLLNGFNDFTRLGPLLEKNRERFIEYGSYIYGKNISPFIYKLCLAEYYYQIDNLLEAEVLVSQTIIGFDKKSEMRLLFAALYLQSKILLSQGRAVNAESYIKDIRNFINEVGKAEFSYNIDASEVLCALYEGNYKLISSWFKNDSPDEYADFNMLDLYRYMIKMRCYIVNKNYAAVIALVEKLRPLLKAGKRHMDLCELDLLLAIALYAGGEQDLAFEALERALKIAKRRQYFRLIADEGDAILHILIEYVKVRDVNPFLMKVIELSRNIAIRYPLYLKVPFRNVETFTQTEIDVLKLLEQGKSKEEIGDMFFISVNTVKYHMKNLYAKLGAKTPHQAVWNGKLLGII